MTGTTRSSAGLEPRRKRLLFRCWHRGMREMDLIFGGFADVYIDKLSDDDIGDLERLAEVPDPDLFSWITGSQPVPVNWDLPVYRSLCAFHTQLDTNEINPR